MINHKGNVQMKTSVLTDNVKFPEGPRWHAGKLWFSDYGTRQIMNVDLQGNVLTLLELPDMAPAFGWTPMGRLILVSPRAGRLLRLDDSELVAFADLSGVAPYGCGELVIDAQGRAYTGSAGYDIFKFGPGYQADPKFGPLVLVTPDGSARIVADGMAFPNGMVITPDGQTLIVAESHANRLTAFTIESDGSLSHRRVWAQFDQGPLEHRMNPDGMCLDAEGAVWVASPVTKEVIRVREGAEITQRIPVDTFPLACMLGGPERRTLFITTTEILNPWDSNVRGRIETTQVDIPGAGLP